MAYFPLPDVNSQANLVDEQTKRLLEIQRQAYAQKSGFAQNIGAGLGQGIAQGAEAGIQDHHVMAFLKQAETQGRLAKGLTADTAFQQYKAGFGSQGMLGKQEVKPNVQDEIIPDAVADKLKIPRGLKRKDAELMVSGSNREFQVGEKKSQYVQKRLTLLGDALDPSKQRMGAFGVSKQVFDRAERLQSMAAAALGNPDKRQMEELAIGINAMLSGANTGAQEQVKALVPQSFVGDANKLREWLTNNPTGTGQQQFVKRLNDTISREKATAADQIKRTQLQRVSRYADLEKSDPEGFQNVIESAGLSMDEYKAWKKGGFKALSAVQDSKKSTQKVGRFTVEEVQ